jgi:hypothetical protein
LIGIWRLRWASCILAHRHKHIARRVF